MDKGEKGKGKTDPNCEQDRNSSKKSIKTKRIDKVRKLIERKNAVELMSIAI